MQRRHLGLPLRGVSSGFTSLRVLVGCSRSVILVSYYHNATSRKKPTWDHEDSYRVRF